MKPALYPSISIPTPIESSGQQSIGTPYVTASRVEFHPQCVTNAPVDGCLSTSTCGAHDSTTRPRSLVRSKNPTGRTASRLLEASATGGVRTVHRNRCPDLSSLTAISLSCSAESRPLLPKQRNTTLRSGCAQDTLDRWHNPAGDAHRIPERLHGPGLQRLERVHQDAVGVHDPRPHAHDGLAQLLIRVLQYFRHDMRRRERRHAWELEWGLAELPEPGSPTGQKRRHLRHDGQGRGRRSEERVHGHAQLGGNVDGVGGEHAGDQGVQAVPGDGEEEGLECVVVPVHQLEHEEEWWLAGASDRVRDSWEDVEGDARVRGGEAIHDTATEAEQPRGRLDERDGDVGAMAEEDLGELHHGDDVPCAWEGEQDDGLFLRRHGFLLHVDSYRS
ncbi:hypothetical protein EJB05_44679, partial [Eragrostis curvula]